MKLEIKFHVIELPVELMQICGTDAACVYAVINAASSDGFATISNNEIGKQCGLPGRSIPANISKLVTLGVIERRYNKGYATTYYVKDILHPTEPKNENEVKPEQEQQKSEPTPPPPPKVPKGKRYQMPYYVMLDAIGSPLAADMPLSESDVDNLTDDRETELCTIPSNWAFSDDQKTVEDALKYLAYYSQIKAGQKKDFVESTIIAVSESICNGMKNTLHGCNPETIISRLNTIIHSPDINLGQWLDDFARVFSEKFDGESKKIYNYHAYLKTAAINYLTEYKSQVYNGFYEDE